MQITIVDAATRREHSRVLRQLTNWRRRYANVSQAISDTKLMLRYGSNSDIRDQNRLVMSLNALRESADFLMTERTWLKEALRETAYKFAPREVVEVANKYITEQEGLADHRRHNWGTFDIEVIGLGNPWGWNELENHR